MCTAKIRLIFCRQYKTYFLVKLLNGHFPSSEKLLTGKVQQP
jgi:hypothetical protein